MLDDKNSKIAMAGCVVLRGVRIRSTADICTSMKSNKKSNKSFVCRCVVHARSLIQQHAHTHFRLSKISGEEIQSSSTEQQQLQVAYSVQQCSMRLHISAAQQTTAIL
jgi:hypothetical protein